MLSAIANAFRILVSLSPTYLPSNEPISKRNNGCWNNAAAAFAVSDLPQPGIPAISVPFGAFTPNSFAA